MEVTVKVLNLNWVFKTKTDEETWGYFVQFICQPIWRYLGEGMTLKISFTSEESNLEGDVAVHNFEMFIYTFLTLSGFHVTQEQVEEVLNEDF
jgi:hypothetical protein